MIIIIKTKYHILRFNKAQIHDSYENIYEIILEDTKHISINTFNIRF